MNRIITRCSIALSLAIVLSVDGALAQQIQHVSYKSPAENSKYTQQLNIDVGDLPNHIVRIWELHRTYPNNAPIINGFKLVEEWERGIGDRIDGNGDGRFYHVYVMENGDKFFSRTTNTVNSVSGKLTTLVAGYITGGTGKFAGLQGNVRGSGNFDLQTGFNELEFSIDYSIGK